MPIMRKILLTVIVLVSIAATSFAETVYLKSGEIVRGKIAQEDATSIMVETSDKWQRIEKSNVEFIKKDDAAAERTIQPDATAEQKPVGRQAASSGQRTIGDFRIKLGSAAGIDEGSFEGVTFPLSSDSGGNFQLEYNMGFYSSSPVGLIVSVGLFSRQHSGNDQDPFGPTQVDYDATGLSLGAGVGIKATDTLHFEGKVELGFGSGEPTLSTPGFVWNPTEAGGYTSVSVILGGYLTFGKPGFQLGLELGSQSFDGDFTILTNTGQRVNGNVNGSGGTANLVFGYRF